MQKIRPFTTEHTWKDPDNAIDFFEEQVKTEFPEPVIDLLYAVADRYPDALFNVQPSFMTSFIAVAREGDRRCWAFVRPEVVAIFTGHSRNADVLRDLFPALEVPENLTRGSRSFVDVKPESAMEDGVLVAMDFAAKHSRPIDKDGEDEQFN